MKGITTFVLILCLFFSCKKEKQISIAGMWKEVSVYSRDNSGSFYWSGPPRFPLVVEFTEDGRYFASTDVPEGHGFYKYDHTNMKIRFEAIPSGNIDTTIVSLLTENDLVFDYTINGNIEFRQKFLRVHY